jgi:hypothetical protein
MLRHANATFDDATKALWLRFLATKIGGNRQPPRRRRPILLVGARRFELPTPSPTDWCRPLLYIWQESVNSRGLRAPDLNLRQCSDAEHDVNHIAISIT